MPYSLYQSLARPSWALFAAILIALLICSDTAQADDKLPIWEHYKEKKPSFVLRGEKRRTPEKVKAAGGIFSRGFELEQKGGGYNPREIVQSQ